MIDHENIHRSLSYAELQSQLVADCRGYRWPGVILRRRYATGIRLSLVRRPLKGEVVLACQTSFIDYRTAQLAG
jgi:hypothetical protein